MPNTSPIDLKPFLTLRRHLKIVHHIPGRLRVRIGIQLFKDVGSVNKELFDRILDAIDGVDKVRLNAAAGSVIITYVPTRIDPNWWHILVTGDDDQALALLHRLISTHVEPSLLNADSGTTNQTPFSPQPRSSK